eukprot:COSAG01_NODE_73231_length_250_cov_3.821192_1_plen_64_part_01
MKGVPLHQIEREIAGARASKCMQIGGKGVGRYSCSRYPGTLDWTSLRNDVISRNRRNLQNRNSA